MDNCQDRINLQSDQAALKKHKRDLHSASVSVSLDGVKYLIPRVNGRFTCVACVFATAKYQDMYNHVRRLVLRRDAAHVNAGKLEGGSPGPTSNVGHVVGSSKQGRIGVRKKPYDQPAVSTNPYFDWSRC